MTTATATAKCMYKYQVEWLEKREQRVYPEPNNSLNIAIGKLRLALGIYAGVFPSHHCGCSQDDIVCGYERVEIAPLCQCHPSVLRQEGGSQENRILRRATNKSHSHEEMEINKNEAFTKAYQEAYEKTKDERFQELINLTKQLVC